MREEEAVEMKFRVFNGNNLISFIYFLWNLKEPPFAHALSKLSMPSPFEYL